MGWPPEEGVRALARISLEGEKANAASGEQERQVRHDRE
jgi:hypothetical protein